MSLTNLPLFERLLKDWKSAVSKMSVDAAVAPLACLSQNMMTRTISVVFAAEDVLGIWSSNFHPIEVIVHFLPILVDSVVPCAILHMLSVTVAPATTTASSRSKSKNFISRLSPAYLP